MAMKIFKALLPYFGGKRKLCPIIFKRISEYLSRDKWSKATFVDGFLGSGAIALFAKAQGFRVLANDIAERSRIAGQALIENSRVLLSDDDLHRLCFSGGENNHFIEKEYSPDVFTPAHAKFLDGAFSNATTPLLKYILLKYIFAIRPYSKFSSPNAFNRPMEEQKWDEIKPTYAKHIKDNLKAPLTILKSIKEQVNSGIFSNGHQNHISQKDIFEFVKDTEGEVLYLDPPYTGTLAYETEYEVLDRILGDEVRPVSKFSQKDGIKALDDLLGQCGKFPLWVISFGNAGGKNELKQLAEMISRHRRCKSWEFAYRHCESVATDAHKNKSKEWVILAPT